jgi:hypothetical protein
LEISLKQLLVCIAALFLVLTAAESAAGQTATSKKAAAEPALPASARLWKSQTTGKEFRVWTDRGILHAEWVNIPLGLAKGGAYIRSELRRAGPKWAGTSKLRLPCESVEDNKPVSNWCSLETKIEIAGHTADRITGRGESLKRFDCRVCKILETGWANFEWVAKEPKAGDGKQ